MGDSQITAPLKILRAAFDKYAGKEGNPATLNKKEATELLSKELFEGCSMELPDDMYQELDLNEDGTIDFTEFALFATMSYSMMMDLGVPLSENPFRKSFDCLRKTFDAHAGKDKDSCTLSKKEFTDLMRAEYGLLNMEIPDSVFKQLDESKDDKLNFNEFVRFAVATCLAELLQPDMTQQAPM